MQTFHWFMSAYGQRLGSLPEILKSPVKKLKEFLRNLKAFFRFQNICGGFNDRIGI